MFNKLKRSSSEDTKSKKKGDKSKKNKSAEEDAPTSTDVVEPELNIPEEILDDTPEATTDEEPVKFVPDKDAAPPFSEPEERVQVVQKALDKEIDISTKWLSIEHAIYKKIPKAERKNYNRAKILAQLPTEQFRIFPLFCSDQIVETESFNDFEVGEEYRYSKPPPKMYCGTVNMVKAMKNHYFLQTLIMRELFIFIIFMIFLIIVLQNINVEKKYYLYEGPKEIFESQELNDPRTLPRNQVNHLISIYKVRFREEMYLYINKTFLFGRWLHRYFTVGAYPGDILPYTRIMGVIRFRTINIRENICKFLPYMIHLYPIGCMITYRERYENRSVDRRSFVHNIWKINESMTNYFKYGGKYSANFETTFHSYGPGGYMFNMNRGLEGWKEAKHRLWVYKITQMIHNATRAVALEFVFVDVWTSMLGSVKVWFEIFPEGGMSSHVNIRVAKIYHIWSKSDCYTLGFFYGLVIMAIYYLGFVIREIMYFGLIHCFKFSTWVHLGMSFSIFFALYYNVKLIQVLPEVMNLYLQNPHEYYEIDHAMRLQLNFEMYIIIALCIAFIKCINYLELIGNIDLFGRTLRYNLLPLLTFLLTFAFIFSAISIFAIITFGYYDSQYLFFVQMFYLHVQKIMGHSSFQPELLKIKPFVGVICYFISFYIITGLLFLFLHTALYDSYGRVESESYLRKGWTVRKIITTIFGMIKTKRKPRSHITRQEIRDALKIFFFTKPEIDLFFVAHNIKERNTHDAFEVCLRLLELKGYDREKYKKQLIIEPYADLKNRLKHRADTAHVVPEFKKEDTKEKEEPLNLKHLRHLTQRLNELDNITRRASTSVEKYYKSVHNVRKHIIAEYSQSFNEVNIRI